MEEVQKELALDDSQKKELEAAGERIRASFSGMAPTGGGGRPDRGGGTESGGKSDRGGPQGGGGGRPDRGAGGAPSEEQMKEFQAMAAKLAEARNKVEGEVMLILDPIQQDRILGLLIQAEDGRSLISSQALAEVLGIDANQKERLKSVTDKSTNEMRETFTKAREAGGGLSDMQEQMQALGKKVNAELLAVMTSDQKSKYEALKGEKFTFPESRGFGGPGGGNRGNGGPPGGSTRGGGGPTREGDRPARPEGPGT